MRIREREIWAAWVGKQARFTALMTSFILHDQPAFRGFPRCKELLEQAELRSPLAVEHYSRWRIFAEEWINSREFGISETPVFRFSVSTDRIKANCIGGIQKII